MTADGRQPCLYIQRLGVKRTRHTRTDINNARPRWTDAAAGRPSAGTNSMSERCPNQTTALTAQSIRSRGWPERSGYRPDKTPSRERRVARTERMPVVHGSEWPGPTTCPSGRRRYLCSSNIKTPGDEASGRRANLAVDDEE